MTAYKVEIFEYKTGETEAVIGKGLRLEKAEQRAKTGLSRCNSDYGTRIVDEETGKVI